MHESRRTRARTMVHKHAIMYVAHTCAKQLDRLESGNAPEDLPRELGLPSVRLATVDSGVCVCIYMYIYVYIFQHMCVCAYCVCVYV